MDLATMRNRAYDGLRDSMREFITPEEVTSWLNEAQSDLSQRQKILTKEIEGTVPAGNEIPLPDDLVEIRSLRFGDADVDWRDDQDWFDAKDALLANPFGGPYGRVFGNNIEVYPLPAQGTAYRLRYVYQPNDLVNDTDQTPLPLELQHRMVYYARSQGFLRLNEVQQAGWWMERYEIGLNPPPLGTNRIHPGPMELTYEPGPFDLDHGAAHRG